MKNLIYMILLGILLLENSFAQSQPESFTIPWSADKPQAAEQSPANQSAQTALGFPTTLLNNKLDYPLALVAKDDRFRQMKAKGVLIDAIKFVDTKSKNMFIVLFMIKKGPNDQPVLAIDKFPVVHITPLQGVLAVNPRSHTLMYYSGFLLHSQEWKNLPMEQTLKDTFCRRPVLKGQPCPSSNQVTVTIKKRVDPASSLPTLVLMG